MRLTVSGQTETAEALRRICGDGACGIDLADNGDPVADVEAIFSAPDETEMLSCRAAEKGMNVLLPGSICANSNLLHKLDTFFRIKKKKLIVLFEELYAPSAGAVRRVIQNGTLGEIGIVDLLQTAPPDADVYGMIAETLALAEYWLGRTKKMRMFGAEADGTSCASLNAVFECGALLNLQAVSGRNIRRKTIWELSGSRGNLAFDSDEAQAVKYDGNPPKRYPAEGTALCPLVNALRELSGTLSKHPIGVSESCLDLSERLRDVYSRGW